MNEGVLCLFTPDSGVELGEYVRQDELIANIETDKVTIPVNCPESGQLKAVFAKAGDTVEVGSNLFSIDTDAKAPAAKAEPAKKAASEAKPLVSDHGSAGGKSEVAEKKSAPVPVPVAAVAQAQASAARVETREKMSRIRLRISERMKEAQNSAASLTTFNEVDMSALMALRNRYKDDFVKRHQVKFGYMSVFMKASARALQEFPVVNARIDAATQEIVYSSFVDISVAVATPKGPRAVDAIRAGDEVTTVSADGKAGVGTVSK